MEREMPRSDTFDRPASMMDLLDDHSVVPAPVKHLPNRRALAVLDQMYAYHDQAVLTETVDLSYDDIAA